LIGQRAQLLAAFDVAAKNDVASRIRFTKEGALISAEDETGKAERLRVS
jgi:hypothetical protein